MARPRRVRTWTEVPTADNTRVCFECGAGRPFRPGGYVTEIDGFPLWICSPKCLAFGGWLGDERSE